MSAARWTVLLPLACTTAALRLHAGAQLAVADVLGSALRRWAS